MTQLPLYQPASAWVPTPLGGLPAWQGARRVALDIETRDPELTKLGPGVRRGAYVVGYSFAIEDGPAHYVPMRHGTGANLDPVHAIAYLADQASAFSGCLVGANLQYDLDFLAEEGVDFPKVHRHRDVTVAEPLLDENQYTYGLDDVLARYGLPGKDEAGMVRAAAAFGWTKGKEVKGNLWRLPAEHVAPYAIQDVRAPLQLLRRQERRLEDEELSGVWDLECRLLPVLVRMRRRGVRVDFDRLDQFAGWCAEEEAKAMAEFSRQTGRRATTEDTTKPRVLAHCLEAVGIRVPRTPTDEPSVASHVLDAIDHPAAAALRRAKKFNKLRTTFVRSIRRHAIGDRIHCTFNQLRRQKDDGGISGTMARLSSSSPNLQQQPSRDEETAGLWRSIYRPDGDGLWASDDYASQEPRWSVHWAEEAALTARRRPWPEQARAAAIAAAEAYRRDPGLDHHDMTARSLCPGWDGLAPAARKRVRDQAKIVFLGLLYGMGGAKMCLDMGLPTGEWYDEARDEVRIVAGPEGKRVIREFHERVAFVQELTRRAQDAAKSRGYVRTVLGRKARFPRKRGGRGYDFTHKATNRVVQGSSADQTKQAMVDADAAGFALQLQVHDELCLTVADRHEAEALAEVMENAVPCRVPHKVDVEVGPSWGEAK